MSRVSLENFELLRLIGRGTYGKVVLVRKHGSEEVFAMKILKKAQLRATNQVDHTLAERSILEKMDHPFIVKLRYAFQSNSKLFFILEYCQGGELFFHLGRVRHLAEELAVFYSACIVLALEHLHAHNVIYRDLKPENVLIDAAGYAKLTDFGLSKENIIHNTATTICGTLEYLAPEVIRKEAYGKSIDWWSLGCLIYEMLLGEPPFYTTDRKLLQKRIVLENLKIPLFVPPMARHLISMLLIKDPKRRLGANGADEIKAHPWFERVNWEDLYWKRINPSFKPRVSRPDDVINFDKVFTDEPIEENDRQSLPNNSPNFEGFEYTASPQGECTLVSDVNF